MMWIISVSYTHLEYACEANGIMADTLFTGKYIASYKPKQSKYAACIGTQRKNSRGVKLEFSPRVTVLKHHGCLSWHLLKDVPYSIPNYIMENSLIITPGLNKYREGYSVPFDTHRSRANDEIDKAQRYIIIGYGFGDDHLETHLIQQLKAGKPTLIFTYSLSEKAKCLVCLLYTSCAGDRIRHAAAAAGGRHHRRPAEDRGRRRGHGGNGASQIK